MKRSKLIILLISFCICTGCSNKKVEEENLIEITSPIETENGYIERTPVATEVTNSSKTEDSYTRKAYVPYEGMAESKIGYTKLGEPDEKTYSLDYNKVDADHRVVTYYWKNEAGKTIVAASVIKEEVTDVSFYGDYSGYYSANPYENHIEK